jgi:RHS repeat-associated protein
LPHTDIYQYNGLGQRVEKTVGSTTTVYVYDEAGHLLGEYTPTGGIIAEHIWLNNRPVGVITSTGLYYVQTDQLGAPRVITNSSKTIVWQWHSDPFGNGAPTGSLVYNLRFPGQYFDSETGHSYNYFRDYDPSTGRYIESDPFGLVGGLNSYRYVGDNPLVWEDKLGLKPWVMNGKGDTTPCTYYDQMAKAHSKCKYYPAAAKICRGQNTSVNSLVEAAIIQAWTFTSEKDDEATILDNLRQKLIMYDKQERAAGHVDCKTDCVYGNNINMYHTVSFEEAGLNPLFYGGNWWPQGVPPNPVPSDPGKGPHL